MEKIDRAIILRAVPFEERDQVITALCEKNGKITALARNSIHSKRFGGSLQLFSASEWTFEEKPDRSMVWLKEADLKRDYAKIHRDFSLLTVASLFNELMLKISQHGQDSTLLFKLHSNALALLEEHPLSPDSLLLLTNAYLTKILQWNGTTPRLRGCLNCTGGVETYTEVYFRPDLAGWRCETCVPAPKGESTPSIVIRSFEILLHLPLKKSLEHLGETAKLADERILNKLLIDLMIHHVPGIVPAELKSLRFL